MLFVSIADGKTNDSELNGLLEDCIHYRPFIAIHKVLSKPTGREKYRKELAIAERRAMSSTRKRKIIWLPLVGK